MYERDGVPAVNSVIIRFLRVLPEQAIGLGALLVADQCRRTQQQIWVLWRANAGNELRGFRGFRIAHYIAHQPNSDARLSLSTRLAPH